MVNTHERTFKAPLEELKRIVETLSTDDDRIWPLERWPRMRFRDGFKSGANGGHGPIRYTITAHTPDKTVFTFVKPKGFLGTHGFALIALDANKSKLVHTIKMKTTFTGTLLWVFAIKWLHDALIEDLLDKVSSQLSGQVPVTPWNLWVRLLRWILK